MAKMKQMEKTKKTTKIQKMVQSEKMQSLAKVPDLADGKAASEAEAGKGRAVRPNMRLTSRKKIMTMQRNFIKMYDKMSP